MLLNKETTNKPNGDHQDKKFKLKTLVKKYKK